MIRLALRVPAEHSELVLAELLELAPAGVEEVYLPAAGGGDPQALGGGDPQALGGGTPQTLGGGDPQTLGGGTPQALGGGDPQALDGESEMVEYAVYGPPGELPELPDLQAAVGGVPIEVHTSEIPDDWAERWRQFHRPVRIEGQGHTLHVRPPWEPPSGAQNAQEIVIDPGQAFGTGAHPTTHMCLELLLAVAAFDPGRGTVLDVGSGSGVLAIAAARLGYRSVLALDNERESVEAIAANAVANGVELESRRFDLLREPLPGGGSPQGRGSPAGQGSSAGGGSLPGGGALVLANLLRPLLLSLCSSIEHPPRHLIASGLLLEEADEIARAFRERLNLCERERRERGEWAALWLTPA